MTNSDAELIRLCNSLVTIGHEQEVTYQEAAPSPAGHSAALGRILLNRDGYLGKLVFDRNT
jgi:hypothetical protein